MSAAALSQRTSEAAILVSKPQMNQPSHTSNTALKNIAPVPEEDEKKTSTAPATVAAPECSHQVEVRVLTSTSRIPLSGFLKKNTIASTDSDVKAVHAGNTPSGATSTLKRKPSITASMGSELKRSRPSGESSKDDPPSLHPAAASPSQDTVDSSDDSESVHFVPRKSTVGATAQTKSFHPSKPIPRPSMSMCQSALAAAHLLCITPTVSAASTQSATKAIPERKSTLHSDSPVAKSIAPAASSTRSQGPEIPIVEPSNSPAPSFLRYISGWDYEGTAHWHERS